MIICYHFITLLSFLCEFLEYSPNVVRLPGSDSEFVPCPTVMTEEELIRFLRIPGISIAKNHRHGRTRRYPMQATNFFSLRIDSLGRRFVSIC